ncbi:MAG: MBL fold metallo-hydrolase [Deltaproteobacteria bacterium]|nr:MBL fold metallo-hydrolase [Deltaproteobacteria bacterium]
MWSSLVMENSRIETLLNHKGVGPVGHSTNRSHFERGSKKNSSTSSRRALLFSGLPLALLFAAKPCVAQSTSLRLLKIRHSGFLLQIAGVRVVIDPWLYRIPGEPLWVQARSPSLSEEELGPLDLLCLTGSRPGQFDLKAIQSIRKKSRVACLVPTPDVAKKLRHIGFQKIRVVRPFDEVRFQKLKIQISPAGTRLGAQEIGFHFSTSVTASSSEASFSQSNASPFEPKAEHKSRGVTSVWHMGSPVAFGENDEVASFAQSVQADLVLAYFGAFHFGEYASGISAEDALLLAKVARALWVVPQGDAVSAPFFLSPWLQKKQASDPSLRILHLDGGAWTQFR